ncbi:MAG TPA: hypothetical protein VGR62_23810 [Candidatus Binatia bacterium]|jgi:hypothetical protein|nr:hypothetical protein [Candidatus Binatia bacterium]
MNAPTMPWLAISAPAAFAGAVLLVVAIRGLVRALRVDALARLPIVPEQRVTLPGGDVMLSVEGRFGTMKFGGLGWTLHEADGGRVVPTQTVLLRRNTTSLSGRTQLALRRFTLDRPSDVLLRTTGLDAATDYTDCALLLTRPTGALLPLWIVATVLGALLFLGGLVTSILLFAGELP